MKKEIVAVEQKGVSVIDFSNDVKDSGFENVTAENMAIPFIKLLQDISPQVKRGANKVEGAESGMFYNTVSNRVFEGPFNVIPCSFDSKYVEWTDNGSGSGEFVAVHDASILKDAKKEGWGLHLPNGNKLVQTAYHYVLIVEADGSLTRAVIALAMTQLKNSKKWVTLMQSNQVKTANGFVTPPMYAYSYEVTSRVETKNTNSWSSWNFASPKMLDCPDTYRFAKEFYTQIKGGLVKTDEASLSSESTTETVMPNNSEHF